MDQLKKALENYFISIGENPLFGKVVISSRPDLCDYQCNGAFALSKKLKQNPNIIAQQVIDSLKHFQESYEFSIAGAGFINIKIKDQELINLTQGSLNIPQNNIKTIIDYGSPNVAKGMHVGHLRSTLIGSALVGIHKYAGETVIGDNHLGDWGTPLGIVITKILQENNFTWNLENIEKLYISGAGEYKSKDPAYDTFKKEVLNTTSLLQKNDLTVKEIWKKLVNTTIESLKQDYNKLGISFDLWEGESTFEPVIPKMIEELKDKNLTQNYNGALVIDIQPLQALMLEKSGGGYLYHTTDLACLKERHKKYDQILYVVDNRQKLHFEQVFAAAQKVGYLKSKEQASHISFGTINGDDGKPFKTREGNVLKLKDLIDQVFSVAKEKLDESLSQEDKEKILPIVAVGALKFAELKHNRLSDYVFDINKFMELEGFTGPYVMYAGVRAKSILSKSLNKKITFADQIYSPTERELLKVLNQFKDYFNKAILYNEPNHLCEYAFIVANSFNSFYSQNHILKEEDLKKQSHLLWVSAQVVKTLETTLNILGIKIPEKM